MKVCCNYNTASSICGRSLTVSLKYRALEQAVRLSSHKSDLSFEGEERDAFLSWLSENRKTEVPYEYLMRHTDLAELNTPHCRTLILSPKRNASNTAVLYLYGGGFMNPPSKADYKLAVKIVEETGSDVYFPLYPLFPDRVMHETVEAVTETVRRIHVQYPKDRTYVLGFSSGATLCLYLFLHLKQNGINDLMPGRWILNSPVLRLPPNEDDLRNMRMIERYDAVLPVVFFTNEGLTGLMIEREDPSFRYLCDILAQDLHGMPKTDIYYGTHEIPYAYLEPFRKKCQAEGIRLRVHEGKLMMHCWGLYDVSKEGKAAQEEYLSIIRARNTVK